MNDDALICEFVFSFELNFKHSGDGVTCYLYYIIMNLSIFS